MDDIGIGMNLVRPLVLDYSIEGRPVAQCVESIVRDIDSGRRNFWLACINPHSYTVAHSDKEFALALREADYLIPDGTGIVIAAKILGAPVHERITGFDIFEGVMTRLNASGGTVFFLGSTKENLAIIEKKVAFDFPNVHVAGTFSPPFKATYNAAELEIMRQAISQAKPDVLWVGMTAPKQEKWIDENIAHIDVKFVAAIGAVFDFYSGKVKRSPAFFQKTGTEWLPRLLQQPRRLWRRMFVSAPFFMWHVFLERLGIRAGRHK